MRTTHDARSTAASGCVVRKETSPQLGRGKGRGAPAQQAPDDAGGATWSASCAPGPRVRETVDQGARELEAFKLLERASRAPLPDAEPSHTGLLLGTSGNRRSGDGVEVLTRGAKEVRRRCEGGAVHLHSIQRLL